jgi:hypothetical protein
LSKQENVWKTSVQKLSTLRTTERAEKQAMIHNISMNLAMAEVEIQWHHYENNQLKQKMIAQQILPCKLGKKGAEPPNDKSAKQIRDAVNIMDGTISHALMMGGGSVETELW